MAWYLVERNDLNSGKITFQVFDEGASIRMTQGDRVFTVASGGSGSDPVLEELVVESVAVKTPRVEKEHLLRDAGGVAVGKVRMITEE